MTRPTLTLENEIVNFFSHTVSSPQETKSTLKAIPSLVKSLVRELRTLEFCRGRLMSIDKDNPDNKKIVNDLSKFIEAKDKELTQYYYREEIKGT